jgi:hypothetical protein
MIVSGAAEKKLYAAAALAARLTGGIVVIIETRVERKLAWQEIFQTEAPRVPLIISSPGGTA